MADGLLADGLGRDGFEGEEASIRRRLWFISLLSHHHVVCEIRQSSKEFITFLHANLEPEASELL